jgi:hypothetical protein
MSKITVYDHERMSVWVYPEKKMVHHQMHEASAGEVFQKALLAGLAAMREHEATRWLSDDRLHKALSPDDEAWAQDVWFPQAKAAGWLHWAVIQPQSAVGRMSSARFRKWYAAQGINARLFTEFDEAMGWLESQR